MIKIKVEVVKYLDDNKVQVIINNKKYIRVVKRHINDRNYVVINKNEYYI